MKWLERFGYGAENCGKVVSSRPSDDWKTMSAQQELVTFFSNQGRIKRRRMGSAFHLLGRRYSGTLTPTAPTAFRVWEHLPLLCVKFFCLALCCDYALTKQVTTFHGILVQKLQ